MQNQQAAHKLASFAVTHAAYGNLDSIQFAIIQHFLDGNLSPTVDLDAMEKEIKAAIELLEHAAYMLRDRRYSCIEAFDALNNT